MTQRKMSSRDFKWPQLMKGENVHGHNILSIIKQ